MVTVPAQNTRRSSPSPSPAAEPEAPSGVLRSRSQLLRFATSMRDEWLATDGRGGYASSTPLGCPTRRYHGLLVTHLGSGVERYVLLSRLDEKVIGPDGEFDLSVARYKGVFAPQGHLNVESFRFDVWPRTRYRRGDVAIEREVLLARGPRAVLVRYTLHESSGPCRLKVRPFLPYRDTHSLTVENDTLDETVTATDALVRCRPYPSLPALTFTTQGDLEFHSDPHWYKSLEYLRDEERGFPCHEDQWSPGELELQLEPGESVVLAAGLEKIEDPAALWEEEIARPEHASRAHTRGATTAGSAAAEARVARIERAAEDFLYRRPGGGEGILAGYPWFGEWGRDTFIALPGLTLARGELERCGRILEDSVEFLEGGLLPNVFGAGRADSHYNSADASLWFARAVELYADAIEQDAKGAERERHRKRLHGSLLPALHEIAEHYESGTALGIGMDESGLLHAGSTELNATWMDAQTPDGPVTPREGCAVELNALWYALLQQIELHHTELGARRKETRFKTLRRRVKRAFLERLWLEDEGYLADRWHDGEAVREVRPNMVIAAAIGASPLTRAHRRAIVERAREDLLTTRGLRTLAPDAPAYVGRYRGAPEERDGAYHQGTVWPWLLGFYTEAHLRAFGKSASAREELLELWTRVEEEADRVGLDHVSEVFDGDPPHNPGGTIAQAWNTAELLRARALLFPRKR